MTLRTFFLSALFVLATPVVYAQPLERMATGDEVVIENGAKGRIFGAGWRVSIQKGVFNNDILAVGAEVVIHPEIANKKVFAFGQNVLLDGVFKGAVAVAGQNIIFAENAIAHGQVWLSGRHVVLKGQLPANGKILAQRVTIEGNIKALDGKHLEIQTKELEILEKANIEGDILYRGESEPRIHTNTHIKGELIHDDKTFEDQAKEQLQKVAFVGRLGSKVMLLVWLLVAGFIVSVFMAPKMIASTKRVRRAPLKMMSIGLGYLIIIPIGAIFMLISVVGMPVGIAMMASYPLAIIMGFSIGVLWLGMLMFEVIFRRKPKKRHQLLGSYFMAIPLIVAITQIPYVGLLGWFVPLCAGLGAFSWLKYQQMQAGKE